MTEGEPYYKIITTQNASIALPLEPTTMSIRIDDMPVGADLSSENERVLTIVSNGKDKYGDPTLCFTNRTQGHEGEIALAYEPWLRTHTLETIPARIVSPIGDIPVEIAHSDEVARRGLQIYTGNVRAPVVALSDEHIRLDGTPVEIFLQRDQVRRLLPPDKPVTYTWLESGYRGCEATAVWKLPEGLSIVIFSDQNRYIVVLSPDSFRYEELLRGVGNGVSLPVLYTDRKEFYDEVAFSALEIRKGNIRQPAHRRGVTSHTQSLLPL